LQKVLQTDQSERSLYGRQLFQKSWPKLLAYMEALYTRALTLLFYL